MAKSTSPGSVQVPGAAEPFFANAVPDTFDERDLEYQPRLEPLPPVLDKRDDDQAFFVWTQKGQSCTGHAVASMINTVLAQMVRRFSSDTGGAPPSPLPRVSPYMLYYLARRYDEYPGEADAGSSLRGVLKGWFHHGVCQEADWPVLDLSAEPDLGAPDFIEKCRERPLGAFYRVNPYRLDDMQSAISELHAIAVSGVIHDGWIKPVLLQNEAGQSMYLIRRSAKPDSLGGHAFALVGYNRVGFLVQNSWGQQWGKGGFATLPYEDWLDSAFDAWVARPGVPQTPFYSGRTRTVTGTSGELVIAPGPDLQRLAAHVVSLGNDGRLSNVGKFGSTPAQIDRAFQNMHHCHTAWQIRHPGLKRHIVIYAHGGMVSQDSALSLAENQLSWWLNNHIYPIYFAWKSGPADTILDQILDDMRGKLPSGGIGFSMVEQFDRLVEKVARTNFTWAWDQMKQNARAASDPLPGEATWPAVPGMESMPGASLVVNRLAKYVQEFGPESVVLHLVGHSAGSIFHAALLQRLVDAGIQVETLTFLAPGLRVDEFRRDVYPLLGSGKTVARFATFNLGEGRELSDGCGANGVNIYHKSLLYLVSRALERPSTNGQAGAFEVPLLGMTKYFSQPFAPGSAQTLQQAIQAAGGALITSPSTTPADSRTDALGHGNFNSDSPTLTSVVMRVLGLSQPLPENNYQANAALRESEAATAMPLPGAIRDPGRPEGGVGRLSMASGALGKAAVLPPKAPQPAQALGASSEVAVAPRSGSPIVDMLQADGWRVVEPASDQADQPDPKTRLKSFKGGGK